jgi:membrane protein implicated in regulation of membrane protease activity
MISLLLLVLVVAWLARPYLQERQQERHEEARRDEKVELRRAMVARMPESPSAHEALGDALRAAGKIHAAIASYQTALEWQERTVQSGQNSGGGDAAGSMGLEQKLRLARLETDQTHHADRHGLTLHTRQQICRRCGDLNDSQERHCRTCDNPLPVDHFFDAWHRDEHRQRIIRESAETFAMILVVLFAVLFASALPIEIQCCVIVSAVTVLLFRMLKRIGDGPGG